jgi:arylsulfatase A-like enzyme
MLFEGGIRVPFALSWPAKLPKGKIYDYPIISLDLFATCIAAAGIEINASDKLDGLNLLPLLSEANIHNKERTLYWRVANGEEYAIRKGNFKLIKSAYKNKTLLFDLEQDRHEIHDISAENPKVIEQLITLYKSWNAELAAPRWTDPHMDNVKNEEANTRNYRRKSLSKKEQALYE